MPVTHIINYYLFRIHKKLTLMKPWCLRLNVNDEQSIVRKCQFYYDKCSIWVMCCYLLNSRITNPGLAATQFDWKVNYWKTNWFLFALHVLLLSVINVLAIDWNCRNDIWIWIMTTEYTVCWFFIMFFLRN